MATNDERREVARKLREVNPYRNQSHTIPCNRYIPAVEYLSELAGALGYSPRNDVSRLEFQNRLADLIEPSCDRDELLMLADILGSTGEKDCRGCRLEGAGCAECSSGIAHEAARRIREALGVQDA